MRMRIRDGVIVGKRIDDYISKLDNVKVVTTARRADRYLGIIPRK